jgi:hypothetical protein
MSVTEDREYRVTWRSISTSVSAGGSETLEERVVTAAYYRRDEDRYVFKRADGMQAFDVAADLVETIEVLDSGDAKPGAIVDQRDARYVFTAR